MIFLYYHVRSSFGNYSVSRGFLKWESASGAYPLSRFKLQHSSPSDNPHLEPTSNDAVMDECEIFSALP